MSIRIVADRFALERLTGAGGMGAVYEAHDVLTGSRVAVKLMRAEGVAAERRFIREGALLATAVHPAIVRYVAHGAAGGELYLAMEWLAGEDLASRLGRGPLTPAEAVGLVAHLARGLAMLHERDIIHRDLKPSNVFLVGGSTESAKLLDFGIARRVTSDQKLTGSGVAVGTPAYMAPEHVRGEELTSACDVFALGLVLFESITGRPAFGGEHAVAILARILLESAPAPSTFCPDLPEEVDALVGRMLAKEPSARPADGRAVARELDALGSVANVRRAPPSLVSPSRRPITTSEQRVVSIVLGGAQGNDATMSADEGFAIDEALAAVARMRGARIERFAIGGVLLTFPDEDAPTDGAVKAARAALRIRDATPGFPLAIATGKLLVGPDRSGASSGDAIDRAAALLAATRAGVSIDETTARLIEGGFDVRPGDGWRELFGERSAGDATRTLLGRPTPCVGRERELTTLTLVLDECESESVARAVLLVGEPGFGKSRIRHEFLRRIAERGVAPVVWLARADLVGKGSPLGLVAQAVRRAAGIFDGEPLLLRQAKIAAEVSSLFAGADKDRIVAALAELVGAGFDDGGRGARKDPIAVGDAMRRAFEDYARARAARAPLLIVLEDLHWGDRPTVLWIDALLRNLKGAPIMVLALARPEVRDLFPNLWTERSLVEIAVGELGRRAAEKLTRDVLGAGADAATVTRLVDQAAGNAFYLEELIRAASDPRSGATPATVLAMVEARLDALEPEARRVLRAASVFGAVFWRSGVAALLGSATDVDDRLREVAAAELVEPQPTSVFPGEDELRFRHALVREAAYAMLTDDDRRVGHRHAARWLEKVGEDDALKLASHYELGGLPAAARTHYERAAAQALEGNDFEGVIVRVAAGIAAGASGEARARLSGLAAEAQRWLGDLAGELAAALDALAHAPVGSAVWSFAVGHRAIALIRLAKRAELEATVPELLDAAPVAGATGDLVAALSRSANSLCQAGLLEPGQKVLGAAERWLATIDAPDPWTLAMVLAAKATGALTVGNTADYFALTREAVAHLERTPDRRGWCVATGNVAYSAMELGQYDEAEARIAPAIAEAERLGLAASLAVLHGIRAIAWLRKGRVAEARDALAAIVALHDRNGNLRSAGTARCHLARAMAALGDLEGARAIVGEAVTMLVGSPPLRAYALAVAADLALAADDTEAALAAAEEASAIVQRIAALEQGDAFVRLAHARTLERAGRAVAYRAAILAAADRLRTRAARISDPAMKEVFLTAIAEHAETVARAASS